MTEPVVERPNTTIPALKVVCVTPFDEKGAIDEDALATIVRHHADHGLGIYMGSFGSGEGHLMSRDEIRRIYEIAVEAAAGRAPVYAAALGFTDTAHVIELAQEAVSVGIDAIQLMPPRPGPPNVRPPMREMEAYYTEFLDAVHTPVHLTNEGFMVGYSVPPKLFVDLVASYPNITSINSTDLDFWQVLSLVEGLQGRVPVHIGLLAQLGSLMSLGVAGPLGFEATIIPELCTAMMEHFRAGRLAEFGDAYGRVVRLNGALMRYGNPRSVKAAQRLLGLPSGYMRRPYLELEPDEVADIRRALERLDLI